MARRGTEKGVYYQIKIPVRIPILLHQKEGWKALTRSRLSETERTNDPRHLSTTPHSGPNTANRRRLDIHQVRRTVGVQ